VSSITSSWQDLLVRRLRRPRRELLLWAVGFLLVAAAAIAATLLSQSDRPGYPRTLDLRLTWLTVADSGCPGVFPPSTVPFWGIHRVGDNETVEGFVRVAGSYWSAQGEPGPEWALTDPTVHPRPKGRFVIASNEQAEFIGSAGTIPFVRSPVPPFRSHTCPLT
jgi:hypothetical protein